VAQPRPTSTIEPEASQQQAARFGLLVRERRRTLRLNQSDLALATGVTRHFIMDLEAGKATAHLGRALLVAEALGLRLFDRLGQDANDHAMLPDMPSECADDEESPA
jgi:transcriptional regulator with XRE-family HTH domain